MDTTTDLLPALNHCWQTIGVSGDRSCPQLVELVHCRNCSIYANAGRSLLEREVPADYLAEWSSTLATSIHQAPGNLAVMIFRIGREWLALSAMLLKEVTPVVPVHTIPHRSNHILKGLVNIRGELQLCASLGNLIGVDSASSGGESTDHTIYQRMIVVEKDGNRWVFSVDEIEGIHRIDRSELRNLPATLAHAKETYTQGIFHWQQHQIGYLDDELLFYILNRRVL
jgi:chemotaxis-related protein WspD